MEQPDKLAQLDMRMLLVHGDEVGGGRLGTARARGFDGCCARYKSWLDALKAKM